MYMQQTSECYFTKILIHVNSEQKELTQVNLQLLTLWLLTLIRLENGYNWSHEWNTQIICNNYDLK